jgi:hypothetical protein
MTGINQALEQVQMDKTDQDLIDDFWGRARKMVSSKKICNKLVEYGSRLVGMGVILTGAVLAFGPSQPPVFPEAEYEDAVMTGEEFHRKCIKQDLK